MAQGRRMTKNLILSGASGTGYLDGIVEAVAAIENAGMVAEWPKPLGVQVAGEYIDSGGKPVYAITTEEGLWIATHVGVIKGPAAPFRIPGTNPPEYATPTIELLRDDARTYARGFKSDVLPAGTLPNGLAWEAPTEAEAAAGGGGVVVVDSSNGGPGGSAWGGNGGAGAPGRGLLWIAGFLVGAFLLSRQ
jgi:hypothetical protein